MKINKNEVEKEFTAIEKIYEPLIRNVVDNLDWKEDWMKGWTLTCVLLKYAVSVYTSSQVFIGLNKEKIKETHPQMLSLLNDLLLVPLEGVSLDKIFKKREN